MSKLKRKKLVNRTRNAEQFVEVRLQLLFPAFLFGLHGGLFGKRTVFVQIGKFLRQLFFVFVKKMAIVSELF